MRTARMVGLLLGAGLLAAGGAVWAGEESDALRDRAQRFDRAAGALLAQAMVAEAPTAGDSFAGVLRARVFDLAPRLQRAPGDADRLAHGTLVEPPAKRTPPLSGRYEGDWVGVISPVEPVQAGEYPESPHWMRVGKPIDRLAIGPTAPVPEPSTTVMLLAGLAVGGLALARRRAGNAATTSAAS